MPSVRSWMSELSVYLTCKQGWVIIWIMYLPYVVDTHGQYSKTR